MEEGTKTHQADPKPAKVEDAPKFGRRQHRQLSSTDSSGATPSENVAEAAKEAQAKEKWVDDIVADVDAIPEMSDAKDDRITTLLSSTPTFKTTNSIQSLKELDGEIGLQLSANAEGIDLSLLTRVMFPPDLLEDPDVPWKMDQLLSEIASND